MKTITFGVFIALFLIRAIPVSASGNTSLPAQAGCNLNKVKFDELKSIQSDDNLDYNQRTKAELQTRKALLKETVRCSIEEAGAVKDNLLKANANDSEAKSLQLQFASRLEDAIRYYELQKSKIDDLGLWGSRDFAGGLKDWRDGNYKPAARLASDFIIWSQNQELMQTAQKRLDQIGSGVNVLRLVQSEEIQNLWTDVNKNFDKAREANQDAKLSLRSSLPDDALVSIKVSLAALSQTYTNLFDLFSAIKNSLSP